MSAKVLSFEKKEEKKEQPPWVCKVCEEINTRNEHIAKLKTMPPSPSTIAHVGIHMEIINHLKFQHKCECNSK